MSSATNSPVPRWAAVTALGPWYEDGVKSSFVMSPSNPWSYGNIVDVLNYLSDYFQEDSHRSTGSLEMTIASQDGKRATLKILSVPNKHIDLQYSPDHLATIDDDILDFWFYLDDVIDDETALQIMEDFFRWLIRYPLTRTVPRGLYKQFSRGQWVLILDVPDAGYGSGVAMTYKQLQDGLTYLVHFAEAHLPDNQRTAFDGRILDDYSQRRCKVTLQKVDGDPQQIQSSGISRGEIV